MKRLIDATALAALLAVAATASADTHTWTPGVSGSWDDGAKWSPNGVPAAGDVVQFGGTYNADTTVTVGNTAAVEFGSINVAGQGSLIFQGASPTERTMQIANSSKDLGMNDGPIIFDDVDTEVRVTYSSGANRRILAGGSGNGSARIVLSGDSAMKLFSTHIFLAGGSNGARLDIKDDASLILDSGSEFQPGRGSNRGGGLAQFGGLVKVGNAVTFGSNENAFGTWEMFGGAATNSSNVRLGWETGAVGALYVHDGSFAVINGDFYLGNKGRSELFADGGEIVLSGHNFCMVTRTSDSTDYPSVLTLAGNATVNCQHLYPYNDTTSTYAGQSRAMVNLNGDSLLSLTGHFKVKAGGTATRATLSFNGGTLQRITSTPDYEANKELLTGIDTVIYSGGGKLKARKSDGTASGMYLNSAKFRKAGGWGVSSIAVASGGSGYLLPPLVDITGGSGSNATAVAQIDYDTGAVTNVIVTCPGEGYASGDTLSVSFVAPDKPVVTAATATATLAENTAGTLRIVDGSTVALGATFRYDGDFVMESGTQVPITGNITLGGTSAFRGLDVRDNATLVFAGPATARDADLKGLGKIVIAEGGSLAVSGYASLRGTVEVARASTTPLITAGSCSFNPATGSSYVATLVPAEGLRAYEPIPVVAVSGNVVGELTLDASATDKWRIRTKLENGVTTIYLCPKKGFVISFR